MTQCTCKGRSDVRIKQNSPNSIKKFILIFIHIENPQENKKKNLINLDIKNCHLKWLLNYFQFYASLK